jgi:hypothetical protein
VHYLCIYCSLNCWFAQLGPLNLLAKDMGMPIESSKCSRSPTLRRTRKRTRNTLFTWSRAASPTQSNKPTDTQATMWTCWRFCVAATPRGTPLSGRCSQVPNIRVIRDIGVISLLRSDAGYLCAAGAVPPSDARSRAAFIYIYSIYNTYM